MNAMACSLKGARILLVEDDGLIALATEYMLQDAGAVVVGPASSVRAALMLVEDCRIDVALLDVRLGSENVFPVADMLAANAIPFVFLSGHGEDGLPPHLAGRPCLTKPCDSAQVFVALGKALKSV